MGQYIAKKTVKLLLKSNENVEKYRVGVLGFTFKENCPDIRNTRIIDIIKELSEYGFDTIVHDPIADVSDSKRIYNIDLVEIDEFKNLDAIIVALAHDCFKQKSRNDLISMYSKQNSRILIDVKSIYKNNDMTEFNYWSL